MPVFHPRLFSRVLQLLFSLALGLIAVGGVIVFTRASAPQAPTAPIPPPEGYPKLTKSMMMVNPTLAGTGGAILGYIITIRNTGAYQAAGVTLLDVIPENTTYREDALSSTGPAPEYQDGILSWTGEVGFDSQVVISFSVIVAAEFQGEIVNQAVITQPLITQPVTVTAKSIITDQPILAIAKTAAPSRPGPNKSLTYELEVTNLGQPAVNLPVTVKDEVPALTTVTQVGPDGSLKGNTVTWDREINLGTGETSLFTFTVRVGSVPSGTVVSNVNYEISSTQTGATAGELYTTTIINPILAISKDVSPNPPGSNRWMTYTLTVLNSGSEATGLELIDHLPAGVTYVSGGAFADGQVSWSLPSLSTGEIWQVSYVVSVPDIAGVTILNDDYEVCSAEGVCQNGQPVSSKVMGPVFVASATLDPVAKKPGGGTGPVTPTLTVENLGPGNALAANVRLSFTRISISLNDLVAIPNHGTFQSGPTCGEKCLTYIWTGDLGVGEGVTFTVPGGRSTIGGEEGNQYIAAIAISDTLGITSTQPVTASAIGRVTHFPNLVPTKTAPGAIGPGQTMTYTLRVYNSGLSTLSPPYPVLTETIPLSTSLVNISDDGVAHSVNGRTVISWTLPDMSPGDFLFRSFSVQTYPDMISGTQIVNDQYRTTWLGAGDILSNTGEPITTVVKEIGLVDSFKVVTPTLARPGKDNRLTYTIHLVNTSPMLLQGVVVDDLLPWQASTYSRDATATSGTVVSDIVSLHWTANVAPYASELLTFTVWVDDDFSGAITNTATITHSSLKADVVVQAVSYITNDPVLKITKTASPDPIKAGQDLLYTLQVTNLGQQATLLVVTDTLPLNTQYVEGSASAGGQLMNDQVRWEFPALNPGEERVFTFQVTVSGNREITNDQYGVNCAEGVSAIGAPVTTKMKIFNLFMPLTVR